MVRFKKMSPRFLSTKPGQVGSALCGVSVVLLSNMSPAQNSAAAELQALEAAAEQTPALPPAESAGQLPPSQPATATGANSGGGVQDADRDVVSVTGSRIKRRSIASAAPVSVLTKQDMLAVVRPSLAEILQSLPSSSNAINLQFNNGGDGSARVNLRSLGVERTLVLLNGRRFVPGGNGDAVDLNALPTSIIERVEILKDGGSAIYGSDAVAGVVNIITKKHFAGVEANAYSSVSERGDGRIAQVDVTGGLSSDDGLSNLVFSVQFLDQEPIFAGKREYSQVQRLFDFDAFDAAGRPGGSVDPFVSFGGSSAVPGGRISDRTGAPGNAAWDALNCHLSTCQNGSANGGDLGRGWRLSGGDEDLYNFQPENYLSTPFRRLSLFTLGNLHLGDSVDLFFEGSLTRRDSQQLLASSPFFSTTQGVTVSADNRYNPFGRDFVDVRRRTQEAGNRLFTQEGTTTRLVTGLRGEIPSLGPWNDWSWDAYVNYGRTDTVELVEGEFNRARLVQAVGPDSECTGDCVPLDLFSGPGTITQEMIDYISFTGVDRRISEQFVAAANLGGPLFHLFANEPVAVSLGYQFRREEGADTPNPLTAAGDTSGNARNPTAGFYRANAAYAEVSAPLVSDRPGVAELELTAAARYVKFSSFGNSLTYKVGLRYNPTEYFAVRGTSSTAFRAPSVNELYGGRADTFPNVSDPCSTVRGDLDNDTVAANCAADGLDAGVFDDRTQVRARIGGSPDLGAETADTLTVGVVLEDHLIRGLTASVDFYQIRIDNAVETIGSGTILASCYQQAAGSRRFCDNIERDGNGLIQNIVDTNRNVGGMRAQGIDLGLRYKLPSVGLGRWGLGLDGTYLLDLTQIQADGFEQSYVGNYDQAAGSDPGANPRYRLNAFARWAYELVNAGLNFRYIPSFRECAGGPCNVDGVQAPIERTVDQYFYLDAYAGVDLLSSLGATTITLGVTNLTNATPPFIANGFLAESDAATYDYAGRTYSFRLAQQF